MLETDLSDLIRESLGMSDMFVFVGNNKPEEIERIVIDYHRITKFKSQLPSADTVDTATWDYSEQLLIDRETDTIEYIRRIGSGCVVTWKYEVQEGV